ncbi:MAG TPA: RagB/SusD family nutrient uptake outer membrane protein [Chitinophagaceae bacterium]|nr:RagB/SusD family nutrient uptake outer membrane protein [Chitinophagaceae bacterium]
MKFRYLILLLLVAGIQGCTKKLDLEPQQSIDANTALTTASDVEAAVIGTYSILAGGELYGTNLLMIPDLQASEDYVSWRGTFQGQRQISLKNMTRDNAEANRTWTAAYRAINMANIVLDAVDVVEDEDLRDQYEGEALFIRGIMHFELVRLFAKPWNATPQNDHLGVVIKTKPTFNEEPVDGRATVKATYDQIIADLTAAAEKLPDTKDGIRADRYTALAFLARVYLQQSEYAKARDAANEVIESGEYELNDDITAIFERDYTPESIWEIEQDVQNNAGTSNDGMATFFASIPGIGRADVRIDAGFVASHDPGDLRAEEWYYVGTGARPGNLYSAKWTSFSQNLPVIRLAEMILIRAETNARLGTSVGATPQEDLDMIRNQDRLNLAPVPATVDNILKERFYELAFEGLRIHDIKRLMGSTGDFDWDDDELVFPIPQREVDASGGVIKQNPGY